MKKRKQISVVVFIYNSFKDPLFQNLILTYIKSLNNLNEETIRFDLITYEQKELQLTKEEVQKNKVELLRWNIHWHPVNYHSGGFILLKKMYDLLVAFWLTLKIKIKNRSTYLLAFANVSAAFCLILSQLFNLKLIVYSFEPHSEFMADLGIWNRSSMKYRVLNFLENKIPHKADYILTGTQHMLDKLKTQKVKAKIYRAPTAVDPDKFNFNQASRDLIRKELNILDKHVFVYFGKLGGLYYTHELIELVRVINKIIPDSFFIIATNFDLDSIEEWLQNAGVDKNKYLLREFIPTEKIPDYLSAADFGISAIPPRPSQKYRSPTKIAEYLLCGVPYITCKGISEDDQVAAKHNVGVVLNAFEETSVVSQKQKLIELLTEDRISLRNRCRAIGNHYRSKQRIINILQDIIK